MKNLLKATLFAGILVLGLSIFSYANIINGDFSNGLDGWTTDPSNAVSVINGEAVLQTQGLDSGISLISLFQFFDFPDLASGISFDIGIAKTNSDSGGQGLSFPDFLQVSYLDLSGTSDKNFVNIDVNGPYNTITGLTFVDLGNGLLRFTTNIADLAGHSGTLFFDLSDQDDGFFSTARVDNVNISAVPEPGTLLLLGSGLAGLIGMRRRFIR